MAVRKQQKASPAPVGRRTMTRLVFWYYKSIFNIKKPFTMLVKHKNTTRYGEG